MKKLLNKIWNNVDYSDVTETFTNPKEQENKSNVKVSFMISPLDVPSAWRAYQKNKETFIIEFKYYSGEEPTKSVSGGRGVTVKTGKNSKRIYEINLDIAKFLAGKKSQRIEIEIEIAAQATAHETMSKLDQEGKVKKSNVIAISNIFKPFHEAHPAI